MATDNIRVLVVDDSAVIREILSDLITEANGLELVATASGGKEALTRIEQHRPDVVTLDIQMPGMDGLETLGEILKRDPLPVIMVSAFARREADITLEALELGALDYVAKPSNVHDTGDDWREALLRKIRTAACTDVQRVLQIRKERKTRLAARRQERGALSSTATSSNADYKNCCIAIGISTGGPPALNELLSSLQPPLPPIVIVQHMPAQFTAPFAARLDSVSRLSVKEAETGDVLQPNHVLVAPGGQHLHLRRQGSRAVVQICDGEPVSSHKPSVDVMMQSAAEAFADRCLGVIMTGMGHDGAAGCSAIRKAGGFVLGQDETSSDVYGMNKVAFIEGNVDHQCSLEELDVAISRQCKRMFRLKQEPVERVTIG
jgi:two-component system chemotaxis response regulator CheB